MGTAVATLGPDGRTSPAIYRRWLAVAIAVLIIHLLIRQSLVGTVPNLLWYAVLFGTYGLLWLQTIRRLRDARAPLILHWTFLWGGAVIAIYVALTSPSVDDGWNG